MTLVQACRDAPLTCWGRLRKSGSAESDVAGSRVDEAVDSGGRRLGSRRDVNDRRTTTAPDSAGNEGASRSSTRPFRTKMRRARRSSIVGSARAAGGLIGPIGRTRDRASLPRRRSAWRPRRARSGRRIGTRAVVALEQSELDGNRCVETEPRRSADWRGGSSAARGSPRGPREALVCSAPNTPGHPPTRHSPSDQSSTRRSRSPHLVSCRRPAVGGDTP